MMIMLTIRAGLRSYPVYLGRGLLEKTGDLLRKHLKPSPLLAVSDHIVAPLYAQKCLDSLALRGFKPSLEVLGVGERIKTLKTAERLYNKALEAGLERNSPFLAIGGGVIGDLVGFVASTYLRGVPYVQVPTTLLAMIDSSVGGKVAVNHPRGKNMIGSFYHPVAVIGDLDVLKTLPSRELNSGLGELVKYGIIGGEQLFQQLEKLCSNYPAKNFPVEMSSLLLKPIIRSLQIKGKIVFLDEKEADLRRALNLGHTFGHALEAAAGYGYYLHGEAVAWGLAMAARLAARLNILDKISEQRVINMVRWLDPPPPPAGMTEEAFFNAFYYDKKKKGAELVFVLPAALGKVIFYRSPPERDIFLILKDFLEGRLL